MYVGTVILIYTVRRLTKLRLSYATFMIEYNLIDDSFYVIIAVFGKS